MAKHTTVPDMNLASVTAYDQAMEPMNSMKDLKQIEPTLIENWREQHDQESRREQQFVQSNLRQCDS
ncbi:hypothetical protein EJB05_30304, partial [Eragrostis curvula]